MTAFGMAAAGGTGPVLATMILVVFGMLSWYSLVSFARAAEMSIVQTLPDIKTTKRNTKTNTPMTTASVAGESLSAVWERCIPNGQFTKYIPDLGCVCLTLGCLLFYSAFIGDIFSSLLSGISYIPSIFQKR